MRLTEHGLPLRLDYPDLYESGSPTVKELKIVTAALVGGASRRSPRKRRIHLDSDEDNRDDDFQRV